VAKVQVQDQADFSVADINLTPSQEQKLYDISDELYDMYIEATDYIIDNDLFFDVGVGFNLAELIKKSWENDVHWHIYGAFEFYSDTLALHKFNADTPSFLSQAAEESGNEIKDKIRDNFKRLITLDDSLELFEERYDGWSILFSAPRDDTQKIENSKLLQTLAQEAGFKTGFSYLDEVVFSEDGVFDSEENQYEYWFKNYSWNEMASQEPELLTTLTSLIKEQKVIILNPAYTALFESDGIIDILRKLYPDAHYLQKQEKSNTLVNIFFAYEACGLSYVSEE